MTRRRAELPLLLALCLTACQVKAPVATPVARGTKAASESPATPQAKPAAPQFLKPFGGGSTALEGLFSVDAGFLAATATGRIVANDGATVVAAGAGNIVANDGATIVANDGATIVAGGGGNIVANDGATIVANDGATLLGQDGTSLVGQDGSSVVAGGAGNYLIGEGLRALLAANETALGAELPAAGMLVRVISLEQNAALPVGVDGGGKPVYAVYTDIAGRYKLFLPPWAHGNLRVVASVPGAGDERRTYTAIAPAGAKELQTSTEESSLMASYLRLCLVQLMTSLMAAGSADCFTPTDLSKNNAVPADFAKAAQDTLEKIAKSACEAGVGELSTAAKRRLAQRGADIVLSDLSISSVMMNNLLVRDALSVKEGPAADAFVAVMKDLSAATAAKLQADPAYFDKTPYLRDINLRRAARGEKPTRIEKPADLGRLLVEEYMGDSNQRELVKVQRAFYDVGMPADDFLRLSVAGASYFLALLTEMLAEPEKPGDMSTLDRWTAMITRQAAEERAHGEVAAAAGAPTPMPGEAVEVSTLAGSVGGSADGVGAAAQFTAPTKLVFSPDGGALIVSDTGNSLLRRISLAASDLGTVTTYAGKRNGQKHPVQVPTDLLLPAGLAYDAEGTLYVADEGNRRIQAISAAGVVSTLAGAGTEGNLDGPGATATFVSPHGLAYDGEASRLLVADRMGRRVRAIALKDPDHPVTTLAGNDSVAKPPIDFGPKASFSRLEDVTVGSDGHVYVLDGDRNRVLTIRPDGFVDLVSGIGLNAYGDGYWLSAALDQPRGLAVDARGGLLVADSVNHRIRRLTFDDIGAATTTTVAGSGEVLQSSDNWKNAAFQDGDVATARFAHPDGMVAAPGGPIYVCDTGNDRIRVIRSR